LLWRLPAKVTTSVETLSVETLPEGSPYHPDAVHQLLKLQAEYNWEGLTRAGYRLMQAVPLNRVREEFQIYDLPLRGVPERATGSNEGSEVEEILASGHVGNPAVPGTPPSPSGNQPLGHLNRDLTGVGVVTAFRAVSVVSLAKGKMGNGGYLDRKMAER
jgi:hypothetical protein